MHLEHQGRQHLRLELGHLDGRAPRSGAAGLYMATRPVGHAGRGEARPPVYLGSTNWASGTDPDGVPDRLLDVNRIGPLGSVSISTSPAAVNVTAAGGSFPVTLTLTAAGGPRGADAVGDGSAGRHHRQPRQDGAVRVRGTNATLTVTVPKAFPVGTYPLTVDAGWHGTLATATVPLVVSGPPVARLSGGDRYATAAAISAGWAPGVPVVYVATGLNFPDALAGAAAAGALGAPLLLVAGTSVPPATAAELARLKPERIIILGGPGVVSDGVAGTLSYYSSGGVFRLSGGDRYATAAAISAGWAPGVPVVYVATGLNFPDALAGAAAAGALGAPLLLVAGTSVPPATAAELARLKPERIIILGGPGVVSDGVAGTLSYYSSGGVFRLSGGDRYATAAAISAGWAPGVPVVYVATGLNFPDALAGAAAAGALGAPLLLVAGTSVPPATAAELARLKPERIIILGGPGVVSDGVYATLEAYFATW